MSSFGSTQLGSEGTGAPVWSAMGQLGMYRTCMKICTIWKRVRKGIPWCGYHDRANMHCLMKRKVIITQIYNINTCSSGITSSSYMIQITDLVPRFYNEYSYNSLRIALFLSPSERVCGPFCACTLSCLILLHGHRDKARRKGNLFLDEVLLPATPSLSSWSDLVFPRAIQDIHVQAC